MRGLRMSYLAVVTIAFVLNGWALMQHLSMVPAHDGFIAAALVVNMLSTPVVLWAAFVYGEIAEGSHLRGRRTRPLAKDS